MRRLITHVFLQPPSDPHVWMPLPFVTRDQDDDSRYYICWETFPLTAREIGERTESGELFALPHPREATNDQLVWITPESRVFIADGDRPTEDRKRDLVVTFST